MFASWSLRKKLFGAFSASAVILSVVGGFSFYQINAVVENYSRIADISFVKVDELGAFRSNAYELMWAMGRASLPTLEKEEFESLNKAYLKTTKRIRETSANYDALPYSDGEKELWENTVKKPRDEVVAMATEMIELAKDPSSTVTRRAELMKKYMSPAILLRDNAFALVKFHRQEAGVWRGLADRQAKFATFAIAIAAVLGSFFAVGVGYKLASSLSKTLTSLLEKLSQGAVEVENAASLISTSSEDLSSATTEQASALQETAASVEEMSAMIKRSAEGASETSRLSQTSRSTADEGNATVSRMMSSIDEIDRSNQEIASIVTVISNIESKTKVINEIVFKTQLLSFNASVEAARAGEHGKGFAVVAEEVSHLAKLSGNAASEISALLDESINKVESLIASNKAKVSDGLEISKLCGNSIDEIVVGIDKVKSLSEEVEVAAQEQSKGIAEINKAMIQLDQVTQQNASTSREVASAAEQLSEQASMLRSSVEHLEIAIHGKSGHRIIKSPALDFEAAKRKSNNVDTKEKLAS